MQDLKSHCLLVWACFCVIGKHDLHLSDERIKGTNSFSEAFFFLLNYLMFSLHPNNNQWCYDERKTFPEVKEVTGFLNRTRPQHRISGEIWNQKLEDDPVFLHTLTLVYGEHGAK